MDGKKSKEMNREIRHEDELHRQIQLGALFHASNQPGEMPEGEGEPEESRDNAIAFNGAVGYVTNRQQLRMILLMRNERQLYHELHCRDAHDRRLAREIVEGHKIGFEIGCECPADPALD